MKNKNDRVGMTSRSINLIFLFVDAESFEYNITDAVAHQFRI